MRRVGLNLLYLVPGAVGGTEIYARRLVHELARARPEVEWLVFAGVEAAPSLRDEGWPRSVRLVRLPVRSRVKPLRVAYELTALPVAVARARVDLLHSLGTTSPLVGPRPRVVTIHDLIFLHFEGDFPASSRIALETLVPLGARRADRVLVPSQASKRDVVEHCRVDAGAVDVVPEGAGMRDAVPTPEPELRARFELGARDVILTIAPPLPHKNLDRLLEAHRTLVDGDGGPVLALVGHQGREGEALRARIAALGLADHVRITGWVSDEDLEGLYRLAACMAYPSLYEGFGLPVLEAMRRGVPLACSRATSLPEVAGDAAEMFDPHDAEAMAAAVRRLLVDRDHADRLVERGRARAEEFTWERAARGTIASYERALRARQDPVDGRGQRRSGRVRGGG
ncbi:MAG: glycosyltransferase family 4 protein, partial [Actinomycetota bacterium]|nr:glycosyltransferase family 4 protein [Actinomycetota bacterium]